MSVAQCRPLVSVGEWFVPFPKSDICVSHRGSSSTTLIAVSVLETILYFVLPVAGIYGLVALLVARPKLARKQRYRVGRPWPYEPLFWTANPEGAHLPDAPEHAAAGARAGAERGGARGNW